MILEQYKANNLFVNSNFCDKTSNGASMAYRGDLVIVDGGLDDKGHPNPPHEILRGAVLLADEKITMLIGSLDRVDLLPLLLDKFQQDFSDEICIMLFVVNASDRALFAVNNTTASLIPLVQGVCWNEAMEELAMEKKDFKGQTPADKLVTLYQEMKLYKGKGELKTMDELKLAVNDRVREAWGAV